MCLNYIINNRMKLLFSCLIDDVIVIYSGNRSVGWNLNNIHSIYLTELFFLSESRTGHTRLLLELVKEVLECDCGKCSALTSYLNMLLCLDSLMKSVRETSSRHYTSCELIDNKHLIIGNNIILVAEHKIMCAEGKNHVMLYFKVRRVGKILKVEELLNLSCSLLGKVYRLILLTYHKVTCLLKARTHNNIHLGYIVIVACTLLKLSCKNITYLV